MLFCARYDLRQCSQLVISTDRVLSSMLGARERTMKQSRIPQRHIAYALRKVGASG